MDPLASATSNSKVPRRPGPLLLVAVRSASDCSVLTQSRQVPNNMLCHLIEAKYFSIVIQWAFSDPYDAVLMLMVVSI
jgi:hypothetical protein